MRSMEYWSINYPAFSRTRRSNISKSGKVKADTDAGIRIGGTLTVQDRSGQRFLQSLRLLTDMCPISSLVSLGLLDGDPYDNF